MGRLSESITTKDLQDYFSKFGQVIDVYIPKPFRAFGFVTFVEADIVMTNLNFKKDEAKTNKFFLFSFSKKYAKKIILLRVSKRKNAFS